MTFETCKHKPSIEVVCLNKTGLVKCPLSLLYSEAAYITLQIYGKLEQHQVQAALCLLHGYIIAAGAIKEAFGIVKKIQAEIHLYLSSQWAHALLGCEAGFIDYPTMSIHAYPWQSFGHELTHLISHHAFSGRSVFTFLEEGIAYYYANPFHSLHVAAHYVLKERSGKTTSLETIAIRQPCYFNSDVERILSGSFVGYTYEKYGAQAFSDLWHGKAGETLMECFPEASTSSLHQAAEQWYQSVMELRLSDYKSTKVDLEAINVCMNTNIKPLQLRHNMIKPDHSISSI